MAAKNEAVTRAAAERRLGFVMTAFRGLGTSRDTPAGCASSSGLAVSQAVTAAA